jgi:hypothetical protein
MTETQDFSINRGCDYRLRFRLVQPPTAELGNLTDWNVRLELRRTRGGPVVATVNGGLSGNVPNSDEFGVWDVNLTAAQTAVLTERTYFYAFRRIDTGFVDVLAKGQLFVEQY